MATFKANEVDNYGGQGGAGFFSISNDMEVKQVRLMYRTIDDVEGLSVHRVTTNDNKSRYINCLREYTDPVDVCPLCASKKYPTQAKLFIPVYNIAEKQVQVWDRGKTMFQKISGMCARYAKDGNELVSTIFDVERHGKPKDTSTDYMFYPVTTDDVKLEDLPEPTPVLGNLVLDMTAEEMENFLATGSLSGSKSNNTQDEMPIRRRSEERRTPATNRGEAF